MTGKSNRNLLILIHGQHADPAPPKLVPVSAKAHSDPMARAEWYLSRVQKMHPTDDPRTWGDNGRIAQIHNMA